jgi:hypothetical protein
VLSVPALWFDTDAIKVFAARLGVPVLGDFTERVGGVIGAGAEIRTPDHRFRGSP